MNKIHDTILSQLKTRLNSLEKLKFLLISQEDAFENLKASYNKFLFLINSKASFSSYNSVNHCHCRTNFFRTESNYVLPQNYHGPGKIIFIANELQKQMIQMSQNFIIHWCFQLRMLSFRHITEAIQHITEAIRNIKEAMRQITEAV
ncbi:hypothetical protein B566_EDAN013340 [Ephemera danica]|nr:hypothetical protein B566_EDAN013340 [Ephemera danica]